MRDLCGAIYAAHAVRVHDCSRARPCGDSPLVETIAFRVDASFLAGTETATDNVVTKMRLVVDRSAVTVATTLVAAPLLTPRTKTLAAIGNEPALGRTARAISQSRGSESNERHEGDCCQKHKERFAHRALLLVATLARTFAFVRVQLKFFLKKLRLETRELLRFNPLSLPAHRCRRRGRY
jgi:hypothetical protein